LGLGAQEIEEIGRAALLHDIGKIHEMYAPILRKEGRLTAEEHALMQTHSTKSAELISNVSYLSGLVDVVKHHHENWDGTGYPSKLCEDRIPLGSRIIMVADTIDAMTTDRPYRKALTKDVVTAELQKMRARQFDPRIVDVLLASPLYHTMFAEQHPERPRATPRWSIETFSGRRTAVGT
jgi:HD-GYP domain-containing protein (c-di-GMP phosphodiesterase class II)